MANAILLNQSKVALDPDHVVYLDVERREAHLTNHDVLKLSATDFGALFGLKTGGSNNG